MFKLTTSAKDEDDLSIGFDRDRNSRRNEVTNNKNKKGNYHLRIMLRDVIGFVAHQEKATYLVGYKLKLTRNKDDAVIDKVPCVADARTKVDDNHWYVPHYTSSIQQQGFLSEQTSSKTPRGLRYVERSSFNEKSK